MELQLPKPERLSSKQITERMAALRLPVSIRAVSYHAKEPGCPVQVVGGVTRFRWPDYLGWWHERDKEAAISRLVSVDVKESQARKLAAEAAIAEEELKRIRGESISIAVYGRRLETICGLLAAKLKSCPGKYSPRTVGLTTPAESLAVWTDCARELLTALSETELPAEPETEEAA